MTSSSPSQKNNPLNPISKFLPKSQRHLLETRKKISIEIRAKIHPKIFEQECIYIYTRGYHITRFPNFQPALDSLQ